MFENMKEDMKCADYNQEYIRQRMAGAPVDRNVVIITESMIVDCLNELMPKGDEGKYARLVKLDIKTVTFLKMEYRSISEIANLHKLTSLTKLQLCNNVIKKIQNLDHLVNLFWLDLSFNSIRKIEGLDKLVKLEVLNLHRNFITTLENLDNNLKLEMFHISTNMLDNLENLRYLRRLEKLRSVSLQGNPVSMTPEFIHFFIAYNPHIDLIDYVIVPQVERDIANSIYKTQVDKFAASHDKFIRKAETIEAEEEVKNLHKDAFVDGLLADEFWHHLFENDTEGQVLLQLGGDMNDIQAPFKEQFHQTTKDMFAKGMRAREQRQNEISAHQIATDEEIAKVQEPANAMTAGFEEWGRQTLKDVRVLVSLIEDHERRLENGLAHELPPEFIEFQEKLNELLKDYVKRLHDIWFTLIHHEMDFNEQMEDVNDLLDNSIREIVDSWLELLRGQCGQLRDIEQQMSDRLQEVLITNGESRLNDKHIPQHLHDLISDQEAIATSIQMSHDHHVAVVDAKEEEICQRMQEWQDNFSMGLTAREYERNKARLNEAAHFVDTHYGYLEETRGLQHATIYVPPIRGDQECTDPNACEPLLWYDRLKKRLLAREKKFKQGLAPNAKESVVHRVKSKAVKGIPTRSSFIL